MSQWRDVLHMLENATGGWISTHDIYDAGPKNPSQRIDEIEKRTGRRVERENIVIRGKRATRYRLPAHRGEQATSDAQAPVTVMRGAPGLEAAASPESSGTLFDAPAVPAPRFWEAA